MLQAAFARGPQTEDEFEFEYDHACPDRIGSEEGGDLSLGGRRRAGYRLEACATLAGQQSSTGILPVMYSH